jgi:UDP-N-acetylmuramate dehydrogenase
MPLINDQIQKIKTALPSVKENEPMSDHANFRIGGRVRLYFVAPSSYDLVSAVQAAERARAPWYVFGGGSNLLVADKGFEGLMIQAANRALSIQGTKVASEAGVITALVARETAKAGLTGFEWAVGIPGTVGGAIFGNAGCYGGETKDAVLFVDAFRLSDGKRVTYSNEECRFGYRDSLFKHERHVILGCVMELAPGGVQTSLGKMNEINAKRKENQPLAESSAGCMFKNFEFADVKDIEKLRHEADVPQAMLEAKRIPAGWLVERCGLKGYKLGGIKVSARHANFFVNDGTGTADEIAQLVSLCQTEVRNQFGIPLQTEVQFAGFG